MLVSVIIPTYNRANRVLDAIASALAQTYRQLEVIVVDDGSTDTTEAALAPLTDRIRVVRQANGGPSVARNRGAAEASGQIVAFLDSDDRWMPDKIERQVALMRRAGPRMCCCVCNATVKGADGRTLGHTFDRARIKFDFAEGEWTNPEEVLATRFLLFNQVVAIRRDAFDRVGGFNPALRILEDYELSLRLASVGNWGVIREPLVLKYSDTQGIGVACMLNAELHAEVRIELISGMLDSGHAFSQQARRNLHRALAELRAESRTHALLKHGGILATASATALGLCLRAHRALRRRSPAWPRFEGQPL